MVDDSWTAREITRKKSVQFLVLTLTFTFILNKGADKMLTYLLNADNQTFYTYNYSLGIFGLLLVIPAALLSVWILKGLLLLKSKFLTSSIVDKIRFSKSLEKGIMISEKGYSFFSVLLKLIKIVGKAVLKVMLVGVYLLFMILGDSSSSNGSSGGRSSRGRSYRTGSNDSYNKQKLKNEAQWQAKQKQKEADYAWKHAGKQARYNVNTHHFDKRMHRADSKQRKANEAAKRARNL